MTKLKKLSKKKQSILDKATEDCQPDKVENVLTKGFSDEGKQLYTDMEKLYTDLCKKGVSFNLIFVADNNKPVCFYRIADLYDDEYVEKLDAVLKQMYGFLQSTGYIKFLEQQGHIKILSKGEHLTNQEALGL